MARRRPMRLPSRRRDPVLLRHGDPPPFAVRLPLSPVVAFLLLPLTAAPQMAAGIPDAVGDVVAVVRSLRD